LTEQPYNPLRKAEDPAIIYREIQLVGDGKTMKRKCKENVGDGKKRKEIKEIKK
jgi:hypothetical protein